MKRTELKRSLWLSPGGGLRRTAMKASRSKGARKQDVLRRSAYSVVDDRSGGRCEMEPFYRDLAVLGRCRYQAQQHHHRRPRKCGGSTDPITETAANLLHLCERHHRSIESSRSTSYQNGWLVRAGHDPATVPVLLHVGWCTLTADGTYQPTERQS